MKPITAGQTQLTKSTQHPPPQWDLELATITPLTRLYSIMDHLSSPTGFLHYTHANRMIGNFSLDPDSRLTSTV